MVVNRRFWIKSLLQFCSLGFVSLSGGLYLRFQSQWHVAAGRDYLDESAERLLSALVADLVFTTGADVNSAAVLSDVDAHLSGLEVGKKNEVQLLFRLLDFYPVRSRIGFADGCIESLEHPCIFLDRLRGSQLGHFRIAYRFLVSVVQLHFFKYSEAWPSGYHGLPESVKKLRAAHVS